MRIFSLQDGGVYPYACSGDNRGTYNAREQILLHRKKNRESMSMKEFRKNPSLSPVAVKEAIIIREWLRANQVFTGTKQYELQLEEITKAVDDILARYFSPWRLRQWFLKKFELESNQYHINEEERLKSNIKSLSAKK